MYECGFTNPVDASGTPPLLGEPFAFASSTCRAATSTIATTSDVVVLPTMSAGDILIATMLFLVLAWLVVASIVAALGPVKTTWPTRLKNK